MKPTRDVYNDEARLGAILFVCEDCNPPMLEPIMRINGSPGKPPVCDICHKKVVPVGVTTPMKMIHALELTICGLVLEPTMDGILICEHGILKCPECAEKRKKDASK